MSLTRLSLAGNNLIRFDQGERLVRDIRDGNIATLCLQCKQVQTSQLDMKTGNKAGTVLLAVLPVHSETGIWSMADR